MEDINVMDCKILIGRRKKLCIERFREKSFKKVKSYMYKIKIEKQIKRLIWHQGLYFGEFLVNLLVGLDFLVYGLKATQLWFIISHSRKS